MPAREADPGSGALMVFGSPPPGAVCIPRAAAYAVIQDGHGRVAAVREDAEDEKSYWLPGGGREGAETPEETVTRETHEEIGAGLRITGRLGRAREYFYSQQQGKWYDLTASFFRGDLAGGRGAGEYELHWLNPTRQGGRFYLACHAWAAKLTMGAPPRAPGR